MTNKIIMFLMYRHYVNIVHALWKLTCFISRVDKMYKNIIWSKVLKGHFFIFMLNIFRKDTICLIELDFYIKVSTNKRKSIPFPNWYSGHSIDI